MQQLIVYPQLGRQPSEPTLQLWFSSNVVPVTHVNHCACSSSLVFEPSNSTSRTKGIQVTTATLAVETYSNYVEISGSWGLTLTQLINSPHIGRNCHLNILTISNISNSYALTTQFTSYHAADVLFEVISQSSSSGSETNKRIHSKHRR